MERKVEGQNSHTHRSYQNTQCVRVFGGLAIVGAQDGGIEALRPACQIVFVAHGVHGHKPAAVKVQHDARAVLKLGRGAAVVEEAFDPVRLGGWEEGNE